MVTAEIYGLLVIEPKGLERPNLRIANGVVEVHKIDSFGYS